MRAITDFVGSLNLPDALAQELAGAPILAQHALYVQLPAWLAPVFGLPRDAASVEQLGVSSYFYFRFLLVLDNLLDTAPPSSAGATAQNGASPVAPHLAARRLLTYCNLFEHAVRGLSGLFPAADPFWAELDACKKQYAASVLEEKARNAARGPFPLTRFVALAAGKSAVCNAIVHALSRLGSDGWAAGTPLLACLADLHVALQCMDDVEDFVRDAEQGQYTYAHALVEAYLRRNGVDATGLSPEQLHPYLYTSGTAVGLYALAQEQFTRALVLIRPFPLEELSDYLHHLSGRCAHYSADIEAGLARGRERVRRAEEAA